MVYGLLTDSVTYETGIDEPIHRDPTVAARFIESAMSTCEYGCKIYADPRSRVNVLAHYSVYGCKKTRLMLDLRVLV